VQRNAGQHQAEPLAREKKESAASGDRITTSKTFKQSTSFIIKMAK